MQKPSLSNYLKRVGLAGGRPRGWTLTISDILLYKSAGFAVPVAGAIKLMPGAEGKVRAPCRSDFPFAGRMLHFVHHDKWSILPIWIESAFNLDAHRYLDTLRSVLDNRVLAATITACVSAVQGKE